MTVRTILAVFVVINGQIYAFNLQLLNLQFHNSLVRRIVPQGETQEELCVVMSRYTGFMSSDREEERQVFGPSTRGACRKYIEDATWGDGLGGSGRSLWIKPVKVHYE